MTEASAPARRDYSRATRRVVTTALVAGLMATTAYWAWHQPFMAYPRTLWEISRMPAPGQLPMPCSAMAPARLPTGGRRPRRGWQGRKRRHLCRSRHARRGRNRGVASAVRESGAGRKTGLGNRPGYGTPLLRAPQRAEAIAWPIARCCQAGTTLGAMSATAATRAAPRRTCVHSTATAGALNFVAAAARGCGGAEGGIVPTGWWPLASSWGGRYRHQRFPHEPCHHLTGHSPAPG